MQNRRNAPRIGGGPGPGPGGRPGGTGEKPKDFKGTLRKLLAYLGNRKKSLVFMVFLATGSSLFQVIGPRQMGLVTTQIFAGLTGQAENGVDFHAIGMLLIGLLGLYLFSALLTFFQGFLMSGLSQSVSYDLRKQLSLKINRLPMDYFDRTPNGDILSRFTNDVDTLGQSLNQSLSQIISSITTAVGVLAMMLFISWQMTLVVLCTLPISALLMNVVMKGSQKYFVGQQVHLGEINSQVEEIYAGQTVVKAFGAQEKVITDFQKINQKLYHSAWKSQFFSGLMHPIMNFIGNLGYVAVVVIGTAFTAAGVIAVGDILSFTQYARSFSQPIAQLAQITGLLQSALAAGERIFAFLEEPEEAPSSKEYLSTRELSGQVTFEHVRFGYQPGQTVIQDFNAVIQPGQKVAIVGPTGAGKTTIVKLLMRFYDVLGGSIRIDGHNIRDFDRNELRKLFGMVLQDTWLFGGTIRDNIHYGNLDAPDDEVIAAAKAAHANHFILTLPGGYDMVLNEESSNISQGQKQLLTIARAILADPKIMILDEATSSVDTRTEIRIQKGMDALMLGRTSFVIAHRLSTIRDADLILVMKNGDIVEQGTHEALLAKGGFYRELYSAQFEGIA